jgi:protein SCO1/2
MIKTYGLLIVGIVLGLIITSSAWYFLKADYTYQGSLIDPPVPAADFELIDQNGIPFRLSDQQGKIVLIFFGYTNCPDVCPVTLSDFITIKKQLGEQADGVEFVFITVDPERDGQEHLRNYLVRFDPEFTGLSGDRAELEGVWKDYGVYQERKETGSAIGYLVDHTARVYAIDKSGNWRLTYPFGMETKKMLQDLKQLLKEV